ncbi:S8 family peptidase [Ralstonia solanacearum]|uniref:S8 family peptidase n=1 Tax=Ralstonia solanacearum TaxID=305 RepID=UPI00078E68DA|nr:S8 family serine peptidase [Ralstonia solanacearum]AMP36320.1 serine protease [Ralstonia solanacearum]AXV85114.1 serine protease [Ralstonia solanacearum]AXW04605.1 serine protease [Ralstonia solanacearum]AXW22358.1 serine protease [Ralstonia solanacearum]AXW79316.1 serine protease [Ralstonia solanacearum]
MAQSEVSPSKPAGSPSSTLEGIPSGLSPKARAERNAVKLDGALLRLRRNTAPRAMAVPNSSIESSAVVSRSGNCVDVDVVAQGDAQQAVAQLERLGFQTAAVYRNYISGCLPVTRIDEAAAIQQVQRISKVARSTRSGVVQGQGDYAQLSRSLRQAVKGLGIDLTGKGITVGIVSDSFNCNSELNQNASYVAQNGRQDTMEDDVARGELPGKGRIRILKEIRDCSDGTDEGRAIAEILHDVAPGADIVFYSGYGGLAEFAQGVETLALPKDKTNAKGLAGGGAQVIIDDLQYSYEPAFQSGIVGAAIDNVVKNHGVAYFSAGGNDGVGASPVSYVNNAARFADQPIDPNGTGTPGRPLNFDPSGASQVFSLPVRATRQIVGFYRFSLQLYWDQPFDNSASSLQVCLADKNGKPFNVMLDGEPYPSCTDASVIGQQAIAWGTLLGTEAEATLRIQLVDGVAPRRIRLQTSRVVIDQFGTADAAMFGHVLSPNAITTGAANYLSTPMCDPTLKTAQLERFSSHGGGLMLFDNDGRALARPVLDGKPDIVGPDGASSVFFGLPAKDGAKGFGVYNLNCRYYPEYPYQFYGTSAAAPHIAGVAALMRQAVPKATPDQIYNALRKTAVDMDVPGHDNATGAGFVQPERALRELIWQALNQYRTSNPPGR